VKAYRPRCRVLKIRPDWANASPSPVDLPSRESSAARHGWVPGRDFHLRIPLDVRTRVIRIEVADASGRQLRFGSRTVAGREGESGRGLLLVTVLAARWGAAPREPVGKTVWAEFEADSPDAM
jgi:hypothetical protein